jgi:hypothetical protein
MCVCVCVRERERESERARERESESESEGAYNVRIQHGGVPVRHKRLNGIRDRVVVLVVGIIVRHAQGIELSAHANELTQHSADRSSHLLLGQNELRVMDPRCQSGLDLGHYVERQWTVAKRHHNQRHSVRVRLGGLV